MNIKIKKILLPLASLFLIWQSYGILLNIEHVHFTSWWSMLFTAWVINMFVTGIFAFTGFAYPTQNLLPEHYYRIKRPELLKRINSMLKVDLFRKLLLATIWRNPRQRKKYFSGQKSGVDHFKEQSKKSEFGHLIPFCILNLAGIYFILKGMPELALYTVLINVAGNFYPILLQREHRMRIERLRG